MEATFGVCFAKAPCKSGAQMDVKALVMPEVLLLWAIGWSEMVHKLCGLIHSFSHHIFSLLSFLFFQPNPMLLVTQSIELWLLGTSSRISSKSTIYFRGPARKLWQNDYSIPMIKAVLYQILTRSYKDLLRNQHVFLCFFPLMTESDWFMLTVASHATLSSWISCHVPAGKLTVQAPPTRRFQNMFAQMNSSGNPTPSLIFAASFRHPLTLVPDRARSSRTPGHSHLMRMVVTVPVMRSNRLVSHPSCRCRQASWGYLAHHRVRPIRRRIVLLGGYSSHAQLWDGDFRKGQWCYR